MNTITEQLAAALRALHRYCDTHWGAADADVEAARRALAAFDAAQQNTACAPAGDHAPEPWHVDDGGDGEIMLWGGAGSVEDPDIGEIYAMDNARRIVACVNACAGIPTERLEGARLVPMMPTSLGTFVLERTA